MLNLVLYYVAAYYKIYIQAPYMEVFNIYNIYIGLQNFIYKIDLKVFQWAPIDAWPLTVDVDCPVLWFPLLYLHGLNTRAKLYA